MKTKKQSASQHVAEYLRAQIAGNAWAVGGKIPSENTLTRELGVSRVSVRLAIQQFITLGVLDSVRGKGTYLKNSDLAVLSGSTNNIGAKECRDIEKVLQFRLLLEPEACYLAAKKNDPAFIDRLGEHLHALVANIGESEEFVRCDILFHLEISQACGNPLIDKALREVFEQTQQDHKAINKVFGYKDGVYYHSLIHKAFEDRNPKQARKMMEEHIRMGIEDISKHE